MGWRTCPTNQKINGSFHSGEKMNLIWHLRNTIKTDFSTKGFLFRLAFDLFLSNVAFFLGMLSTLLYGMFKWQHVSRPFFDNIVVSVWLINIPLLTFCCVFSYIATGLYRSTINVTYTNTVLIVCRAVGFTFFIFLLLIYMTLTAVPRSTMITTLFFMFLLILSSRLFLTGLFRNYHISPSSVYNPYIEKIVREMTVLSQQDGWLPPEGLPSKSAWPYFEDDEVIAAAAVLNSGKVNQWTGKEVEIFQKEFAAACNVKHAIALANGTVALELALKAMGIGKDDEVIVTPRTFIASASCAVMQNAKPVFADVDCESQNITAATIRRVITPYTKAIIAVHLAGWPCDMDSIMTLAREYNLKVIEDCAQAHGAFYKGKPVGSFGHAAAFSFCQDKIMTTGGEGGMLLTNDDEIWAACWAFKDHGKSYDAVYHRQHPPGFRWLHESFGTNWRMTEMQAAIGRRQLKKLSDWVKIRRRNAAILQENFSGIKSFRVTLPPADIYHSYYKYYVFVQPEKLKDGWNRDRILNCILKQGAPCFSGSCSEVYLEKAFDENNLRPAERMHIAKELGETSLMFLVHPTLSEDDMRHTVKAVEKVMGMATKA